MPADLKPAARIVDRAAGREKVRAEGRCRICTRWYAIERHHLVPRSLGGDDVDENIVPLCPPHHGTFERESGRAEIGARIRVALEPDELAYVERKKGSAFLDRYYPLAG